MKNNEIRKATKKPEKRRTKVYRTSYFLSTAFKGMVRNGMMTAASVVVLLACITVLGAFTMLAKNIDHNLESLDDLNQIVAFCDTYAGYKDGSFVKLPGELQSADMGKLLGWSTARGSDTPTYKPGQSYRITETDAKGGTVTMYAVWENARTPEGIRIEYNYMGIKLAVTPEDDENVYAEGDKITLPAAPTPSNTSLSFLGWTSVYGSVSEEFAAGGDYTVLGENAKGGVITLYAVWSEIPTFAEYKIVYDPSFAEVENMPTDAEMRLNDAKNAVNAITGIESVEFISKEETLKNEMDELSEYQGLQSLFEGELNPYPDTFVLTYSPDTDTDALESRLLSISDIYKVRCRADLAESIDSLKNGVSNVLFWFSVVLFAVSVLVIVNTVKLAVEYRGKEIEIMRYIGATKFFIACPFELEGTFIGLFSGILSFIIQLILYGRITSALGNEIQMISILPFSSLCPILIPICLLTGVITGFIGSTIAIYKYLKA